MTDHIDQARNDMRALAAYSKLPKLPRPGDPFDGGVVIASCWGNDEPQIDVTVGKDGEIIPPFAEILLLMPVPDYYRLMQIEVTEHSNVWRVTHGTETRHPNIIPAAEDYSDRIGGY